jgi:hypothetical protein
MKAKRTAIVSAIFFLTVYLASGQGVDIDLIKREVNRQIFDPDSEYPAGAWSQTHKYPKGLSGNVNTETTLYPNDEKVFNHFNSQGNLVKYEVYRKGRLNSNFTYDYAEDGANLLAERGTYNLDYFHIDSNNYVGVNAFEDGIGFDYQLDTMFVHESKYRYELTRKSKRKGHPLKKYAFKYNKEGSLLSVILYENDIQVGHLLNTYNALNQVTERQLFWRYSLFANEDEWSVYIGNRVYKLSYDTNGFIQTFTTEIYSPVDRKWKSEVQSFDCSLRHEGNYYYATCMSSDGEYFIVEIDQHGNWIRKEEYKNGEMKLTSRELTYYE